MHDTLHMYYLVFLRNVNRNTPRKNYGTTFKPSMCCVKHTRNLLLPFFNVDWQM